MDTSKKRIRREYAPLNVAVSLSCTTPGSLPTQVYNSENGQWEADRSLTPCVIVPVVIAHAKDNSWKNPYANSSLAEMQWLINGKDITTQADWNGLFSINNDTGTDRGAITIKRNVSPGTVYSLRFKGVLADPRTGLNYPIESEEINLSTADKSSDAYSLSIGESQIIRYDPFKDRLFIYEYKVSHGLIEASEAAENAATDENAYRCNIPVTVHYGTKHIKTGYTAKLYKVSASGNTTELSPAKDLELVSLNAESIVLDLRLITKADYILRIMVDGMQVAQEQFSVNRIYHKFNCRPTNGTAIGPDDTERYDVAMVDCDGKTIDAPESILRIVWKSDSEYMKSVFLNEGRDTLFQLAKTGIGTAYNDGWLDVYTEAEHKPAHCVATDETGNIFTDEKGNPLIFN